LRSSCWAMSENDDIQARRVAEVLTGSVSFDDFVAEVRRRGYVVEATPKSLNGAACHFYKVMLGLPMKGDHDPPLISMFWYIIAPEGADRPARRYTLEIQIRGETGDNGVKIKMFPFSPEGLLIRLEEIEERLVRAWNAIQEAE